MPELAAHLERVARELAEQLVRKIWPLINENDSITERDAIQPLLAAALAARAREAKLEAIKGTIQAFEHEYMNTGEPLSGVARGIRAMCELKFEAERAVGEKANV